MEGRRDLFVIVAATRWDGHAYTERHVAEALSRHGDVLWIEPPLSVMGARRRTDLADGTTRPGRLAATAAITRVVPPTPPGKDRAGIRHVAQLLHTATARWAVRQDGRTPRAVLSFAARLAPFPVTGDRTTAKVAWVKDDLVAGAELTGLRRGRVAGGQRDLVHAADLVVAASPQLTEDLAALGVRAVTIPAGADVERFAGAHHAPPPDVRTAPGETAGFVGQLGSRVDVRLLEAVVDEGVKLLLVGRRADDDGRFDDLIDHPNVTWAGPQPYEALPAHLAAIGVGTVPYAATTFNRASFPLKLLEYLSSGLTVVSTDLPAARWLETELVRTADAPRDFAAAVRQALEQRSDHTSRAARAVASRHSWDARIASLFAHLDGVWSPSPHQ